MWSTDRGRGVRLTLTLTLKTCRELLLRVRYCAIHTTVPAQGATQCSNFTGITSPDNQTRSWLTSQNNQKVVLTGIQYHFGPGAETGPDRPSRALEPSDRHLHTPKQPFHFKYHLFSCRISDLLRLFPAVSGHILTFSRALEQSDAGGHG